MVQPRAETRAGLVLAWTVTLMAILAIGLVMVTAPMPQLTDAATMGVAAPAGATHAVTPIGAGAPIDHEPPAAAGADA
jgi:hypothetical protein